MQIKETIGVSFPGSVESPPLEDVVVLVDSAGVALGGHHSPAPRSPLTYGPSMPTRKSCTLLC